MKEYITKLNKSAKEEGEKVLKSILEVCQIYHMPMYANVVTEYDGTKAVLDNMVYSGQSHQIRLRDDHIRKHILIAAGFTAVPPEDKEKDMTGKRFEVYTYLEEMSKDVERVVDKLKRFSEEHNTSVFVSIAVGNTEEKTDYVCFYNIPECQSKIKMKEYEGHINVEEKDFDVVPPREVLSVDMSEVFGFGD